MSTDLNVTTANAWLTHAPAHWHRAPLGSYFDQRNQQVSDSDFPPLSVTKSGVVPQMETVAKTDNNDNRKLVRVGDFAINSRSDRKGSAGVSTLEGSVSVIYTVLTPRASLDGGFVHHLLRSEAFQEEFYRWGSGIVADLWSTRYSVMKQIPLAVPPLDEQRAIAKYLDRETVRIDTLIEEQQRLIEMLRERRQAVIESAAGRGIDEAVQMKASGLSWIRKVPEHWAVANIRRFAAMKTGHTPSRNNPDYWIDCTIPWFTLADVWQLRDGRRTYLGETESRISDLGLANSAAELLPIGTVVLSRTASVGFTGVMAEPMATSQDFWNWVPGEHLDPVYLMWVFRAMRREFQALMIGSTHKTIYQPTAAALRIPVPPIEEQRRIVAYLDEQTAKIDKLIAETETFIELARERRSALITAAVTGQIDVLGAA